MIIRNRITQNKRVTCGSCGRTHALYLNVYANPTFSSPDQYASTGTVLYEDEIMQIGLDRNRWGLGITRSLYKKRNGSVLYTQYVAYCPSCLRESHVWIDFSNGQYTSVADYIKQKFLEIINRNSDMVYKVYNTEIDWLTQQTQPESDDEEQELEDSDDDLDDDDINDNDDEADECIPIQVGTEVVFIRGSRSDIHYRRDVGKVLFTRNDNGTTILTVVSHRTGQRMDVLPHNLATRTAYRTDFQVGDLVRYHDGVNYVNCIVRGVQDQSLVCESEAGTIMLQSSECAISCFDYVNVEPSRASAQPQNTTESVRQGVIDIWIHHKVKSL